MVMKNKALVLDLDDTLYSEIDFLYSGYKYIALKLDAKHGNALFNKMINLYHNSENAFRYIAEKYQIELSVLLEWYRYHIPEINLFPYVKETLNRLSENYKFAIITDGRSITQRNKLKALKIEHFFDAIIISEEIGSEKPSLRNFMLVQEALKCENYIYVGDNLKKDFVSPNKLGWKTICLKDCGKNIHKQDVNISHEFLPHFYISDWSKLTAII